MKKKIAGLVALFLAGNLFAAGRAADFSAANKLYAEGKFADAADACEKMLQTGGWSPALLFNAGNAEFKSGHLGKAIAAYRRATLLTPRDAELRANLAFVRNQVQGATVRESRWQNWVNTLTLNEGAILTAVLFWLLLGLFAIRQIRPALVPNSRWTSDAAISASSSPPSDARGSADAMATDEYPVNTPTSSALLAPRLAARNRRKFPCSGETAFLARRGPASRAVSSRSCSRCAGSRVWRRR